MNYYKEIKNTLVDIEIYKKVKDYSKNKYELEKYYEVGKLLIQAQGGEARAKYGDGLIKEYAYKLINEIGRSYNATTLKRMRQFYLLIQKGAPMAHQKYINYIDKNIRKSYHDKTIGIIIAKRDNKFLVEYCSDPRIYRTTYILI